MNYTLLIAIVSLVAGFLVLYLLNRAYHKAIHKVNPYNILFLGYFVLILNMAFGQKFYSVEWAFLGYLFVAMLFYDFRIDSRFLIVPALVLLGYIPFMLVGAQKEFAEALAVYVYYFLVVGVVLQVVEHFKKTENLIDFGDFIKGLNKGRLLSAIPVWGVVVLAVIILNRFRSLELLKWTSVYVFVVLIVLYAIALFQERK